MPRVLSIGADGFLRQTPAPEFETLRGEAKSFTPASLEKPIVLDGVPGDSTEIEAEFSGAGTYGFELRRNAAGKPGIVVSIQGQYLNVGSARTYVGNAGRSKLRIFLDKRCIEVYANDGAATVYNWVDAGDDAQGIAVFGQAGGRGTPVPPRLESLKVWPIKPAQFNMDRFHI
jgi:sucrose-6-phosphate hydrolase SacC (GH32 family)